MDIAKTIVERRSVRKYKSVAVPQALLLDLLQQSAQQVQTDIEHAAAWRCLYYETPESRKRLGDSMLAKMKGSTLGKFIPTGLLDLATKQTVQTPVILIFIASAAPDQRLRDIHYAAACRVMQHLQLLGWQQGLGMLWYTETILHQPFFFAEIGLQPDERFVGMLNIGFTEKAPRARKRTPASKKWTTLFPDTPPPTSPAALTPQRILELLDLAVWAPNDGLREPWRFLYAPRADAMGRPLQADDPQAGACLLIIVTAETDAHKREEDLAAVNCLVQNFLLLAEAENWHVRHTIPQWCYSTHAGLDYGLHATEQVAAVLEWADAGKQHTAHPSTLRTDIRLQ